MKTLDLKGLERVIANIREENRVPMKDLLLSAGFVYNERTGFYELNGLTDITYEQALVIYTRTSGITEFSSLTNNYPFAGGGAMLATAENSPRTTLHFCRNISKSLAISYVAFLEVLALVDYPPEFEEATKRSAALKTAAGNGGVKDCPHLREILDPINLYTSGADFSNNPELRTVKLFRAGFAGSFPLNLSGCPKLSFESLQYLVVNSIPGMGATTVTLDPVVYNKITGCGTYDEEHDMNEWLSLLDKATAKGITFTEG